MPAFSAKPSLNGAGRPITQKKIQIAVPTVIAAKATNGFLMRKMEMQ